MQSLTLLQTHANLHTVTVYVEDRLAAWTQLPVENGEDLQILRYELGQK